jgi:hypothetical protein
VEKVDKIVDKIQKQTFEHKNSIKNVDMLTYPHFFEGIIVL